MKPLSFKNNEISYPWDLCRFDENFLRFNGDFIFDEKILTSLRLKSIYAKMLWDSQFKSIVPFNRDLIYSSLEWELSVKKNKKIANRFFLPNLYMSIELAKILSSSGRINRYKHLSLDRQLIFEYFTESVEQLKLDILGSGVFWDISCFHPYTQAAINKSDIDLLEFIRSSEYKKAEGNFIRVSNDENKHLRDLFYNELSANREICIFRFEVSIDTLVMPKGVDFREVKEGLDIVVGRLMAHFGKKLKSAIDVIFPRVLAIKDEERISELGGHFLLIFSGISKSEQSLISDFVLHSVYGTKIGLSPMDLTVSNQKNSASGVLRFSDPQSLPALAKTADFLTIERRLIKPRAFLGEDGRLLRPHTLRVRAF
ncbi:MAG: hypothetical protein RR707_02705 [Comamonas sp.]